MLGEFVQFGQIYQISVLLQWDVPMRLLPSFLYCGTITQPNTLCLSSELSDESQEPPALGAVSRPCRPYLPVDHPSPTHVGHGEG